MWLDLLHGQAQARLLRYRQLVLPQRRASQAWLAALARGGFEPSFHVFQRYVLGEAERQRPIVLTIIAVRIGIHGGKDDTSVSRLEERTR